MDRKQTKPDTNMCIMVVDDQFNVRRMVQGFLRAFGFSNVVEASDGDKAWQKLESNDVEFIICDWNMPVVTGLELLRRVRGDHRYRNLPFLMVTAEVKEATVAEAIEEGVDGYIVKPFVAKTLIGKLEDIMAARLSPMPLDAALDEGRALLEAGRAEEALIAFRRALEIAPESPRSLLALGEALEALERQREALDSYQQAAGLARQFVKAHDRLAALYDKMGEPEKALVHLRQASRVTPGNPQRKLLLGKKLLASGNAQEGAKVLGQAVKLAAGDTDMASEVGELLLAAGMNQAAAEAFSSAVETDPRLVHIYNRLGIAYRRQGKPLEAVKEYRKALEFSPEEENLYFNMAVALVEGRKMSEAVSALREALKIRPDFEEARSFMQKLTAAR